MLISGHDVDRLCPVGAQPRDQSFNGDEKSFRTVNKAMTGSSPLTTCRGTLSRSPPPRWPPPAIPSTLAPGGGVFKKHNGGNHLDRVNGTA